MVKIVVSGASGRMGSRIADLARMNGAFKVVAGLELKSIPGKNIVSDINDIKENYDCIIEFTTPQATVEHVRLAKKLGKAMVIGTTGLSKEEAEIIRDAARAIPIVFSSNMSVGVNVLFKLVGNASSILGDGYSATIKEAHHIHKKDKPSGTAKMMADIVKEKTRATDVPTESIREGEIIGDHEIKFESEFDTIKISHSAKTRDIFAIGALKAAVFIVKKKKGPFSMADVLGLPEN